MKKTLLLSEIFPPVKGGSGRWFWEVYNRLGPSHTVVAAGQCEGSEQHDQQSQLNIQRLPLSASCWGIRSKIGFAFYWRTLKSVRKLVKQHNIEVIHCGRCLPEGFIGFLMKRLFGIPYVCYVHGEDVETAATSRELSWIIRRALYNASRIVCNSQNTANILLEQWQTDPATTQVINPGVDSHAFVPALPNPEFKQQMGWQDRFVVLTVGRLQQRKGQDMLIRATAELAKQHPQLLYVIVGNGDQKPTLEALINELGVQQHVQLLAEISDQQMIPCYQQCDLFVLPNRTVGRDIEGFGMVLVEAQACGKTVIAGDSGGTRETMLLGESGFILDCTTPDALVGKISELINQPDTLANMGKAARQHVETNLDWQPLTAKLHALLDKV